MPLIKVDNFPNNKDGTPRKELQRAICLGLRGLVGSANITGIDTVTKVTVVVGSVRQVAEDTTLVISVHHFLKDFGRTDRDRTLLANTLGRGARTILGDAVGQIEVAVPWFEPSETYTTFHPEGHTP